MARAIEVRQLSKLCNGRTKALDGVDLKVEEAKVFAFLGPNGSGKTTLMRILSTQIRPTSGQANIFGLDTVENGQEIRRQAELCWLQPLCSYHINPFWLSE